MNHTQSVSSKKPRNPDGYDPAQARTAVESDGEAPYIRKDLRQEIARTVELQIEFSTKMRTLLDQIATVTVNIPETDSIPSSKREVVMEIKAAKEHRRTQLRLRAIRLFGAMEDLARFASGVIENSPVSQLESIELRVRNAELEALLIEAKQLKV